MLIVDAPVHVWTSGTPVHVHRQVTHYPREAWTAQPWLQERDLELVMGRALCDWIGWNLQ